MEEKTTPEKKKIQKETLKIPPRRIIAIFPPYLIRCKNLLLKNTWGAAETQNKLAALAAEEFDKDQSIKEIAKYREALELLNDTYGFPDELILIPLEEITQKTITQKPKWKRTSFWINQRVGNEFLKLQITTGFTYRSILLRGFLKLCSSNELPNAYKKRAETEYNQYKTEDNKIKEELQKIATNISTQITKNLCNITSQYINNQLLKEKDHKNPANEAYKGTDPLIQRSTDPPGSVYNIEGGMGGDTKENHRLKQALKILHTVDPQSTKQIEHAIKQTKELTQKLQETTQLFELEKQLPTQSLSEETVRAEYRFFNHHPQIHRDTRHKHGSGQE